MKYVLDTGVFISLKNYPKVIFPSFWDKFDALRNNGDLISCKEVLRELEPVSDIGSIWANENIELFTNPTIDEQYIIAEILNKHPQIVKAKNRERGLPVADPFVIARGKVLDLIVISTEIRTPNAHKVPNICDEYEVKSLTFLEFMANEKWRF